MCVRVCMCVCVTPSPTIHVSVHAIVIATSYVHAHAHKNILAHISVTHACVCLYMCVHTCVVVMHRNVHLSIFRVHVCM
jgi:hypothetical protein